MSLKTRRHQQRAKEEHKSSNKGTVNSVLGMMNDNKFLIGSIVAASGAAVFLFGTKSGKRVRDEIQTRAVDVYNNCMTRGQSDELAA